MPNSLQVYQPVFGNVFLKIFGDQSAAKFSPAELNPINWFSADGASNFTLSNGPQNLAITGTLLVEQDTFTSLPSGWTNPGAADVYANGELIIILGDGSRFIRNIQATQNEMWVSFKLRFSSDFDTTSSNRGSGMQQPGNNDAILLGAGKSSGENRFRTSYRTDSGANEVNTTREIDTDVDYLITMQYVTASAPAADDGIARIWIDGERILEATGVDNDTIQTASIVLGQNSENGVQTGEMIFSEAKMGTTGNPVVFENDRWTELPFSWFTTGNDTYANGKVSIDVTTRSNNIRSNTFSAFAELWLRADWTISADYATVNGQENHGWGMSQAGVRRVHLGLKNNGGTIQFHTYIVDDGGVVETDISSPAVVLGGTVNVVIRVLASGGGAGEVQIYIDGALVLDSTGLTFSTATITNIVLGSLNGSAGNPSAGVWTYDNVVAAVTGLIPNSVSQWNDLSTNANDLTQTTEAAQPHWNEATGAVEFDGVADHIFRTTLTGGDLAQPLNDFVVLDVFATTGTFMSGWNISFRPLFSAAVSGLRMDIFAGGNLGGTTDDVPAGFYIATANYNNTESHIWISGLEHAVGTTGTQSRRGLTLASAQAGVSPTLVNIKEAITFGDLTTAELNQVGNYLADKYSAPWTNIFNPLDFSPTAWYDARDAGTVTVTGAGVSLWKDKSGNGNDFIQSTDADRPAYNTGALASVEFDGVSEFLEVTFGGGALSQPANVFVAFKFDTLADGKAIYDSDVTGTRWDFATANAANFWSIFGGSFLSGQDGATAPDITQHVGLNVFNTTSSAIYVDGGTAEKTGDVGTGTTTGITLGSRFDQGAGTFVNIKIYEIFFIPGIMTTAQQNAAANYLAAKHGTTWTDI